MAPRHRDGIPGLSSSVGQRCRFVLPVRDNPANIRSIPPPPPPPAAPLPPPESLEPLPESLLFPTVAAAAAAALTPARQRYRLRYRRTSR